ncbi:hypothetical protein [Actinopolyspora halophila]|uniref:hypothetical protein n=1 Tax=Actinopolyspora halophila TaxID=1850 RepID=UPI000476B459|nr:hypothetical protein [Actinopolyspora halophila]
MPERLRAPAVPVSGVRATTRKALDSGTPNGGRAREDSAASPTTSASAGATAAATTCAATSTTGAATSTTGAATSDGSAASGEVGVAPASGRGAVTRVTNPGGSPLVTALRGVRPERGDQHDDQEQRQEQHGGTDHEQGL